MAVSRRTLLAGAAGTVGVVAAGAVAWPVLPQRIRNQIVGPPEVYIPNAAPGQVTLEQVYSEQRGTDVDLFTAVPAGYGPGTDLPVVVVLHGASATAADFADFGLPQFVSAAVEAGANPFVLAGATGDALQWEPQENGDNPRAMVLEELPQWLDERGFDADRRALWGWSMGGYGVLRISELDPTWTRATAAFSPAIAGGDPVFQDAAQLSGVPVGLWCGTDDSFYDAVRELAEEVQPEIASFSEGGHTRVYWNEQTIEALTFLASSLGSTKHYP